MNNEDRHLENTEEDKLILRLAEMIMKEESTPSILNPFRLAQIMRSYKIIKNHLADEEMELSYALHDAFASIGTIHIEARGMQFYSSAWFREALKYASNMEVYPLTNGKVRMALTFHGLTKHIS